MSGAPSNRVRIALTIAVMTTLALGSFWLMEVMRRGAEAPGRAPSANEADYTIDRFTFVRLSDTGTVRYRIAGEKLTHYPNDTYEITHPVLRTISKNAPPLDARSERAVVDNASRRIHLYQDVRFDRPSPSGDRDFHGRSEYLMILPDDDIMRTDKPVEIEFGRSRLNGIGMSANNATREFELMEKVHGVFLPSAH